MKSSTSIVITATLLFAALATPTRLSAQHARYKLIDLGSPFGRGSGMPTGFLELNGTTGVQVISNNGTVAVIADTSTPHPLCYINDCFFPNAFEWQRGVLTNLGTPPGSQYSGPTWISGNGLIVGFSENGETDPLTGLPEMRGALWRDDKITDVGTLEGGYESFAFAVNNQGQVAGAATNTIPDPFSPFGTQIRAFLWQKGLMQDLGTLGGPEADAFFVNDRGQVAGFSFTNATPNSDNGACPPNVPTQEPFLWDKNTGMIDIGNFGGTCGIANALNNRGQVAGQSYLAGNLIAHAFLWDKSGRPQLTDLGTLGGNNASGEWLNDAGEVVGYADLQPSPGGCSGLTCVHHGFLWKEGVMTDLGTIGTDPCSRALSNNSKGQIVGATAGVCGGALTHGFLWENGGPAIDLNTLVAPGSSLSLVAPTSINNRGEIAGYGVLANGETHGFVLIPCEETGEGCESAAVSTTVATQVRPAPSMQNFTNDGESMGGINAMRRLYDRRQMPSAPRASASLQITISALTPPPPPPPTNLFGMNAHGFCSGATPWPTSLGIGTIRMWDDGTSWTEINTALGVYNWSHFDACVNTAVAHGAQPIYVFGRTPQWASSNPSNSTCVYGPGQCAPPGDLAADGTGTDQDWKSFVNALVARAAGRILLWEMWNEPLNPQSWTGTIPQLVRMQNDASLIIKAAIPGAQIISPANSNWHGTGGGTPIANWLTRYWAAGGGTSSDIVGFHGYYSIYSGDLYGIQQTIRSAMSGAGQGSKPLWDTEGGWQNDADLPSASGQAAFLAQYYLLHQGFKIPVFAWYAFDDTVVGTLWTSTGGLHQAGVTYGQVQQWLSGATMTSTCQPTNNVWACPLTRTTPTGYQALAVWDVMSTVSYTPASQYKQYRDTAGIITPISGPISVGALPLLLETVAPTFTAVPTSLTFAGQVLGTTSAAHAVTVTNTGDSTMTISSIALAGANASEFAQTNTCGSSLEASASCVASVTFSPTATGTRTATLTFTTSAAGSPQSVPLTGTGLALRPNPPTGTNEISEVNLAWLAATGGTDPNPIAGYNVYRGTVSGGPYTKLTASLLVAKVLSYADLTVTAGVKYYYVVTSVDSAGNESLFSTQIVIVAP